MFDLPKEACESILVIIGILENPSARKFLHPISVETYFKLGEQNLISDNTELIEGVIFQKMPKSPLHYSITQKLLSYFITKLTSQFMARQESILEVFFLQPENGNYKMKKIFQKQDTIYPEFDKNLGIFIGDFFL